MKIDIKEHERGAMINGVLLLRSLAKMLEQKDRTHAQRVLIWAQMIEDVVERMEKGQ